MGCAAIPWKSSKPFSQEVVAIKIIATFSACRLQDQLTPLTVTQVLQAYVTPLKIRDPSVPVPEFIF